MTQKCLDCRASPAPDVQEGLCVDCRRDIAAGALFSQVCLECNEVKSHRAYYTGESVCKRCRYDRRSDGAHQNRMSMDSLLKETVYNLTNGIYWGENCDILNIPRQDERDELAEKVEVRLGFDPREQTYGNYVRKQKLRE